MSAEPDLSCAQAAVLLGVSRSFLNRLALRLEVPHYRHGRRLTFSPEHIETIRRHHEVLAAPVSALPLRSRRAS